MDQGLRFDSEPVPFITIKRRNRNMNQFKLELKKRTVPQKITLGANHITAMTGNAFYPVATRVPTDAQVQTAQTDLITAQAAVDAAEIARRQAIQARDQKAEGWDIVITARANNCEAVTPDDLAALASTGFPLRTGGGPIGSLPAPGDLRATPTDNAGEIELRCNAVKGAGSYEWQCRLHDSVTTPWSDIKTVTTSRILVPALTPGALYAFRVRAIGSAGPGTWSDEAVQRAP
jgi:hypothetical protein